MQSTGQTSTQALSFTLMHGSAMIYGIKASRAISSIWSDQALLTRRTWCVKHSGCFGAHQPRFGAHQPRFAAHDTASARTIRFTASAAEDRARRAVNRRTD